MEMNKELFLKKLKDCIVIDLQRADSNDTQTILETIQAYKDSLDEINEMFGTLEKLRSESE